MYGQVVKNGHRKGKVAKHTCCRGPSWYVMLEEDEIEKSLGKKHIHNSPKYAYPLPFVD